MFVSLPSRDKAAVRWATPLLFAALWLAFLWSATRPQEAHGNLLMDWGALSDGPVSYTQLHVYTRQRT